MARRPTPLRRALRCLALAAAAAGAVALSSRAQTIQSAPLVQLPDVNALTPPPARVPIYYPPDPPAPGAAADRVGMLMLPQWDAPAELAPFVGELFYPQLATRLAEREMSKKLNDRVQRYKAQREKLAGELRAALRAGGAFGSTQALAELDAEAQKLREDLALDEFHWNRYRQWSPAAAVEKEEKALLLARQFHFLRASVFYRDGLSAAQRRLLHDFVLWFSRFDLPATQVTMPPVTGGAVIGFFPMPSYIRLPDTLPRDVATELQGLLRARHDLQKELVTALLTTDAYLGGTRTKELAALATRQQPQIEALEQQAEAVRGRLAAISDPAPPPLAAGALELGQAFASRRLELEQDLIKRLTAVRRDLCRYKPGSELLMWKSNFQSGAYVSIEAFRSPQELMAIVDETHAQAQRRPAIAAALQKAVAAFKTDTAAQQKDLDALRGRYLLAAVRALHPELPPDQPVPSEIVARTARRLMLDELRGRMSEQSDYLTATLRPGLPPAQRRLLLSQSLADMAPPLPPGVRRPVYRLDTP